MMRRASSASDSRTEIRTSPRPLTVSGKMLCGTSEATTEGTPFASSRPRTMLASTSECVRKMTTRSGTGTIDLQQNHGHIVVLRDVANKRGDLSQNALAELFRRQVGVLFEDPPEPHFAEAIVLGVHCLSDAVGEQQI